MVNMHVVRRVHQEAVQKDCLLLAGYLLDPDGINLPSICQNKSAPVVAGDEWRINCVDDGPVSLRKDYRCDISIYYQRTDHGITISSGLRPKRPHSSWATVDPQAKISITATQR